MQIPHVNTPYNGKHSIISLHIQQIYIWVFPGTDCVKVHLSQFTVLN